MTPVVKTVSVVTFLGTTVGAGGLYFGTDLFKSKSQGKKVSISSLMKITNPEKRLITAKLVGDDDGKKSYTAYRKDNKDNEKDIGNLKNGTKPVLPITEQNTTDEFISKCESNSQMEVAEKDDPLYKQVLAYCTRNTLVSDLIKENIALTRKQLLDVSSVGKDKESGWTEAGGIYKAQNSEKGDGQDPWGLENGNTKKNGDELPTNYKTKCDEYSKKPAHRLDDDNYKNVLAWCTK